MGTEQQVTRHNHSVTHGDSSHPTTERGNARLEHREHCYRHRTVIQGLMGPANERPEQQQPRGKQNSKPFYLRTSATTTTTTATTKAIGAHRVFCGSRDISSQRHGHTDQAGAGVDVKVLQGCAVTGDLTRDCILKTVQNERRDHIHHRPDALLHILDFSFSASSWTLTGTPACLMFRN